MDDIDLVERFQLLIAAGNPMGTALHAMVQEAIAEDRTKFAYRRDSYYTRVTLRSVAEDLLDRLIAAAPDLKIMRDETSPTALWHLAWMLDTVRAHVHTWPLDKLGRWLGYVQGVLVEQRKLDVGQERDRTRAAFQVAYAADGLNAPETL